jgi:hypothetical protein
MKRSQPPLQGPQISNYLLFPRLPNILRQYEISRDVGSSVGIATRYGLDDPVIESR